MGLKEDNLVKLLHLRAQGQHSSPAYIWLQDGEKESNRLSYRELDDRAKAIGSHLQSICKPGDRALLLYPSGLEFIAAFFGCLYGGVVAVPAYPPKRNQKMTRLQAIVSDAGATVALTTGALLKNIENRFALESDLTYLRCVATDNIDKIVGSYQLSREATPDTLAFLQYTSGSTGKPKGVMVSHGNLLHNSEMLRLAFGNSQKTVYVGWLPLFHDMGLIAHVLQALYVGSPCILMSPGAFLQKPIRWLQAISRYKGTTSGGPNFAYDLCVNKITPEERANLDLSSWEVAFNGAEPVRCETLERFSSAFADCGFRKEAFYPCYGMAEATVFVSGVVTREPHVILQVSGEALEENRVVTGNGETRDKREIVSCGRAWLDEKIAIVDPESLTQCPDNQVGEIWVSSSSVAQGYWRKPEQTEETFCAYLADRGEGPFLRTGDLGFLQDGELFVTGRLKDLIIIRGRNYYPQDIEQTVEQSHPELRANCSAAFSVEVDGSERVVVVAEVERQALKGLDVDAVVESIRSAVWWEYELQLYGVLLLKTASIPKTSSGKIQRHGCRQGFVDGSLNVVGSWQQREQGNRELPLLARESLSTWLAEWIGRELGVAAETIDPNKSLFYYGLDSVTAMQLARDLEERVGRQISPSVAWDYPTIAALTSYLAEERTDAVWAEMVEVTVGEKAKNASLTVPEKSGTVGSRSTVREKTALEFPLSSGQKALWFLYKLAPFSWAYNIILAVRICSQVDVVALRGALQALVDRHEILRTTYRERNGEPQQLIKEGFELPWTQIDGSSWNAEELKARVTDDGRRPFNLEESAFRVSLFTREASDHVLLLAVHHISCDFWSMLVLMDELKVLYTVEKSGQKSPEGISIPPLPLSYTDWMGDQNSMLAGSRGEQLWNYWREELGGALDAVLELPTDKPRPPVQTYNGATHSFKLSQELTLQLQRLAQESEATLYTLLLAAFSVLLYRYTGQEDIMVGSPTSGRTRRELENMVGYLVNPVVLRADMSGNPTFAEFIARVRQKVAGAIAHQEYPFGLLVEKLQPQRDPSRSPLFDVMFVLQQPQGYEELAQLLYSPGKQRSIKWGELELGDFEITQNEGLFDLTLETILADRALGGAFKYNTDLFSSGTISRMAGNFQVLLEEIVRNTQTRVDQLPLLSELERHQLLVEWNDTATDYPSDKCIHELFDEQVSRTPDAVAVVFEESQLTYRELNARANQLAHYLRSLGVGPEVLVGICVERSIEMVVGLLSILKAGGAYVPLDPAYPPDRIAYMLSDAQVPVLLTLSKLVDSLGSTDGKVVCLDEDWGAIASWNEENPANLGCPDNVAYIIYTSGSTGKPKGVEVTHRGVVRLLFGVDYVKLSASEKILQMAPISFDASTFEIWGALLHGGECVLYPGVVPTAKDLRKALWEHGITTIWLTAALFNSLVDDEAEALLGIGQLLTGGEALSVAHVGKAMAYLPSVQIINGYGPTENTTFTCCYPIDRQIGESVESIEIGRPIGNTQVYILDSNLQPVPIGVPGELHIGGTGLARGYLNSPKLTSTEFIPNPFSNEPGARLYKTGDRARYRRDGNIEFLGRIDNQVKIRGFRIELGEIEATLAQHPGIVQAVVIAREDMPGDKGMAAYIVAKREPPTVSELRDFLKAKLPEYMVPAAFVTLEAMPLTPNGKVSRQSLPAPDPSFITSAETFVAPRTPTEEILAVLWSEILAASKVGIHDNFFELGGHSLKAIQVITRVREAFSIELPLSNLFEAPTIAELAELIELAKGEKLPSLPVISPAPERRHEPFPLTDIQQAYWLGRSEAFELGNVATHIYLEIDSDDLDLQELNQAWQKLMERHDMLRMGLLPDGQQQVSEIVPSYQITISDLRGETPEAIFARMSEIRSQMSHQVLPGDDGLLFDIRATRWSGQKVRLHLSFDALMADAWSMLLLFDEWKKLYQNPLSTLTPLQLSFRDYVVADQHLKESELYQGAKEYWYRRVDSLPDAPQLPLAKNPSAIKQPRFVRRSAKLSQEKWQKLKQRATIESLTPSGLLVAAFAEVLSVWSKNAHFTINLTLFNRLPLHPQVNDLVGDFTSLTLLEVDNSTPDTFGNRGARIQKQLWQDLDHRYFTGVEVLRELGRRQGNRQSALMPVVFTSALALGRDLGGINEWGEMVYSISQTPQVWLDHQVMEEKGALLFNWDAVEELFPSGMLDDMFNSYCGFLEQLTEESAWISNTRARLPEAQLDQRQLVNATAAPPQEMMLHELFAAQVAVRPLAEAIITPQQHLSYRSLYQRANQVARKLRQHGATPNSLVAVVMSKGWEQIVAVLGILISGAAYLPLDPELPPERMQYILLEGEVSLALTQSELRETVAELAEIQWLVVDSQEIGVNELCPLDSVQTRDDLAYVIYTSGSTGQPKGVAISHRGAVNTICDINSRFGVGVGDRVLAVSALNFDLSVYDIFGILAAGGTVVMPAGDDRRRDPAHWVELMRANQVTLWNSVPALMGMLVEYLSRQPEKVPSCLGLILLSGDWLPVDLPAQIKALWEDAQVVSLGGATEASIWSILYPIEKVDPTWKSIPYGKPMQNQYFQVLNPSLEPVPVWVPGQLYIGGMGLATGYWRDEEKTSLSFITHPVTKERLYKTGDLGRYLPSGDIEFLGREDFQVKVNGYRIELGEIEQVLKQHSAVDEVVVTAAGPERSNKQLVAYVVPEPEKPEPLFKTESAEPKTLETLWVSLVEKGEQQARQLPSDIDIESFSKFWQRIERLSTVSICRTLNNLGVFGTAGESHSLTDIVSNCQIQPRYVKLLGQWLKVLEAEGLLQQVGKQTFYNLKPLSGEGVSPLWQAVREDANNGRAGMGRLLEYFQRSADNHVALLKGEVDPLELFFPGGDWETAESLYQFNPVADYHNQIAGAVLTAVAANLPVGKYLRILEVGAGTGGTTASLLPVLPPQQTVYTYTDLSTFFTAQAQQKFQDYPFVRYDLLDIDRAATHQGYEPHGFDVLVAANVLHDARNIGTSLQYLRSLLAPGGLMLILEGTQNTRLQMITVGFIEGFSHFEDERLQSNLPLLSVEQWQVALVGSCFEKFVAFPGSGLATEVFGQHVMVARAPSLVKRFQSGELRKYLQRKLPEYMVPSTYTLLDALPLTPNGKVDRRALPAPDFSSLSSDAEIRVLPRNPTEEQLAAIWYEVLGVEQVGVFQDFFELGGDSILATKIIVRVRDILSVELPLRNMFESPTVAGIAAQIDKQIQIEEIEEEEFRL